MLRSAVGKTRYAVWARGGLCHLTKSMGRTITPCRASDEIYWEEIFSMPTHGFLIIFRCLLFEPQNIFDAPHF